MPSPRKSSARQKLIRNTQSSAPSRTATFWCRIHSPCGAVFIAVNSHGVRAIQIGGTKAGFLASLTGTPIEDLRAAAQAAKQIEEYFDGQRKVFSLELDLSALTVFQREVLAVTYRIRWGEVKSYQQVALAMKRPKASRAAGQALGRNPIPIIIPCHRVVASGGKLGGFSTGKGLDTKRWLLRHEGALS